MNLKPPIRRKEGMVSKEIRQQLKEVSLYKMKSHTEQIICPECGNEQTGTVEHTILFASYVHECTCGYIIMESEWNRIIKKTI